MVFREAILQEKSECVEFLLDCGVSAVEDLDMLELYQKTNKGLQKNVSEIFHKSKKEYDLKRIMDFISEDKEDTPNRCTFVKELCKKAHNRKKTKTDLFKEEHETIAYSEQQQKRDYRKELISQLEQVQLEVDLSEIHRNIHKKYADFKGKTESDHGSRASMSVDAEKESDAGLERDMRNAGIRSFTDRILEQFVPRVFVSKDQNTNSTQKQGTSEVGTHHYTGETVDTEERTMGGEIFTQLFLWAVLTNRNIVARHFWTRGQDLVVSALIAGTIMESIADKTYNSRKKAIRKENASFYRSLTVGTMDACYWDHKKTTVKLIDKRIKDNSWGVDFLALAFESKNSSIFNSEGMVFYTLSKWYGDIPKSTSMLKVGLTYSADNRELL
ncbi:transient receptor potential cation channel subfamily M member 5-like [Haliotis rubra]|uniref:transient receptor potential cation channel subfamily M member 5-like n=1 Tax=Haliotis rubra TaxID=36100 RepID=UPI001EE60635|nr:transient receptor potential cation channel subfamily M member 5-like [Haliotis rubra]